MKKISIMMIGALFSLPAVAETDVLLATHEPMSRGLQRVALDIYANAPFAGFEFEIEVPDASRVGTKRCVSELPISLNAKCVITKWGTVKAIVYLTTLGEIPGGWYRVGYLDIPGTVALSIKSVVFADGAAAERVGSGVSSCSNAGVKGEAQC